MICQFIFSWVITLRCLLVKWYIDILLVWEHVDTTEFYKKRCVATVRSPSWKPLPLVASSRLYCSLFPQTSDRTFLECSVSTLGSLSPASRVTRQLATPEWFHLKGLGFCLSGPRSPWVFGGLMLKVLTPHDVGFPPWRPIAHTDKDWEINKPSSMLVHQSDLNSERLLN